MDVKREALAEAAVLKIGERCYDKRKLTSEEKRFLIEAYFAETRERLYENCSNCFAKIYLYFLNKSKQLKTMGTLLFKLKEGKRIALHGLSEVITNKNLTNEKALNVLKRAPGCAVLFDVLPPDWRAKAEEHYQRSLTGKKDFVATKAPEVTAPEATATEAKELTASDTDVRQIQKDKLNAASVNDLKDMCKSFEMEPSEYSSLKKPALVALLVKRMGL